MSGFDFDALRDPLAPEPGPRERAGVNVRARELRARRLRNRLATSTGALVLVAAIVVAVVGTHQTAGPRITLGSASSTTTITTPTTAGPSVGNRFIPPTTTQNGLVVLPVTLPDGESFTMKYPPAMQIAQLGFAGGISLNNGQQLSVYYTTIQHMFRGAQVAEFTGADGQEVPLFSTDQRSGYRGPAADEVAFQFGHWLAIADVPVSRSNHENDVLASWIDSLTGTTDANGYLVVHARGPVAINRSFDGGFGAVPGNELELASHLYCGQPGSDTSTHRTFVNADNSRGVSWCDGDLHVSATGSAGFINLADTGLDITGFTTPHGLSTTTTTTTGPSTSTTTTAPVSTSAGAMSASWVSPSHGWALEQSGAVVETTDAGATWTAIGRLGNHDPDTKIRFADATRGFAFNTRYLFETTDGGADWTVLQAPFSDVLDLEITAGTVYAVAFPPSTGAALVDFDLWSAPLDTLAWSKDSLLLPIAAGGEPSEQLVFAGGQGWVLDVMRTVMGGGRLIPGADWAKWNPPCLAVEGPAYLTASTGTDVVAACDEGVWGGNLPNVTPTVYFSHNGGVSFERHLAPGFGLVSSPNPTTAVIATTKGLQRTTDDGATWQSVLADSAGFGAADIGFTTSTQGFVIFENGPMYMTYDAGATWQRARLP